METKVVVRDEVCAITSQCSNCICVAIELFLFQKKQSHFYCSRTFLFQKKQSHLLQLDFFISKKACTFLAYLLEGLVVQTFERKQYTIYHSLESIAQYITLVVVKSSSY